MCTLYIIANEQHSGSLTAKVAERYCEEMRKMMTRLNLKAITACQPDVLATSQ